MDATPGAAGSNVLLAGRYEVGPLVGLGGTARVHRGWDRDQNRAVAVKVFEPGCTPAPDRGGAWELKVLAGLRHPGLVQVLGSGVDAAGRLFVVMDLVDGGTLGSRLHAGPLPAPAVVRLGAVIAAALAQVHARGVVHRDVKPGNILLGRDDEPRLTDFGIARIVGATRVTTTGVVVGTAAYMAPEQVRGQPVGPAADVYALGLVLLEAVTGRREYEGGTLESAVARLHRAPLVPAQVPDPLATVIPRMTAFEPADRPSASDVAAALGPQPVRDLGDDSPVGGRLPPVGRRLVPVGALACLAAATLGGGLLLIGVEASSPTQAGRMTQPAAPAPQAAAPQLQVVPSPVLVEPAVVPSPRRAAVPVALRRPKNSGTPGRAGQQAGDRTYPDGPVHARGVDDESAGNRTTENDAEKGEKKTRGKNDKSDNKGGSGRSRGKG
jgi:eukaryotic-like serine/threonine-protein kinase